jgi:molecular chaperone GrpE
MVENTKETDETLNQNETLAEETVKVPETEMIEKEKYVRLYSEFENYKRRTQKEKEEYLKTANQKMAVDIIPSLDNFERAGKLETGVQLIYDNLKKTLERYGVKEVDAKGLDFNADTMEALTQIPAGDDLKGKVVDVVEKGYELNGKVIRFAKVVVGI